MVGRSERRYLLNLAFGGGAALLLSLRDTEDGALRTFTTFAGLVSFLEAEAGPGGAPPEGGSTKIADGGERP
ncbi:MAG TPA: hypothetical protein VFD39_10700 [Trueperaceae bacterium]|nr:hypothetical protein [Trueperaceae bacterium]